MRRQGSFFAFYLFGAVLVAVGAGTVYYFWHAKQSELDTQLKERAAVAEAGPTVAVATSKQGPTVRKLTLLGEALPYKTATLYAKVSGYLTKISVDKGDHVKAGQFIAEITSPELDHQYDSAVADLENKKRVAKRTRDLADQHFFSEQAAEDAETNARLAEQQVQSVRALKSYKVSQRALCGHRHRALCRPRGVGDQRDVEPELRAAGGDDLGSIPSAGHRVRGSVRGTQRPYRYANGGGGCLECRPPGDR